MDKYKNFIIAGALIVLGFVGYSFFMNKEDDTLLAEETVDTSAQTGDRDLITLLAQLRALTLNEDIFGDSAFRSLQDFSRALIPEPVGRPNPFAPLGEGAPAPANQGTAR